MTNDDRSWSSPRGDVAEELRELQTARDQMWTALNEEADPERRERLTVALGKNQTRIDEIVAELGIDGPLARPTSRSHVVQTGDVPQYERWQGSERPYADERPYIDDRPYADEHPYTDRTIELSRGPNNRPSVRREDTRSASRGPGPDDRSSGVRRSFVVAAVLGVLVALGILAWWVVDDARQGSEIDVAGADAPSGKAAEIASVLTGMGLTDVQVEQRGDTIFLAGSVPAESERLAAVGAATALAGDTPLDSTQLSVVAATAGPSTTVAGQPEGDQRRNQALQTELNRVLAGTPIIFETGQTDLTELHLRILNNVSAVLQGYPELVVNVVGFTDDVGDPEVNRTVSQLRADNVKNYLVSQGIPETALVTDARGEDSSTGAGQLASLERRVEFEVAGLGAAVAPGSDDAVRVAIVAPSARNDLAFTQSMVDAVNAAAAERGGIEVVVTDSTFVPEEAATAIRDYASQGYDLVIAHGSQYGGLLVEIAPEFPEVAFAWGTAADTFGIPNVYAYDVASNEGGYVLGALAATLSGSGVAGVVGPIEVGDAELYVNGFDAGAKAERPATDVRVTYTDSFSDLTLAADAAQAHVDAGADVMTGSAQMVVGAVSVASENGTLWFGTQANQTSLAPTLVVASQVYHWEVILRPIIDDVQNNTLNGRSLNANLANGGIVIEYNPDFAIADEARQRADQLASEIVSGALTVPG